MARRFREGRDGGLGGRLRAGRRALGAERVSAWWCGVAAGGGVLPSGVGSGARDVRSGRAVAAAFDAAGRVFVEPNCAVWARAAGLGGALLVGLPMVFAAGSAGGVQRWVVGCGSSLLVFADDLCAVAGDRGGARVASIAAARGVVRGVRVW